MAHRDAVGHVTGCAGGGDPGCGRVRAGGAGQVQEEAECDLRPQVSEEAAHRGDTAAGARVQREEHSHVLQTHLHNQVSTVQYNILQYATVHFHNRYKQLYNMGFS